MNWFKKKKTGPRIEFVVGERDGNAILNAKRMDGHVDVLPRIGDQIFGLMGYTSKTDQGVVLWVIHNYRINVIEIGVGTE